MVDAQEKFNSQVHITAGQLRRLDVLVPEVVPDRAFVRRAAVGFDEKEPISRKSVTVAVKVLEPFQAIA